MGTIVWVGVLAAAYHFGGERAAIAYMVVSMILLGIMFTYYPETTIFFGMED